jgi:hypothetical protein
MAVGIAPVAIQATTRAVETLDHASGLKGFEVLINRRMADAPTPQVQLFKDVSSTEVALFTPEQVEHHASLAAEPHPQPTTLLKHLLQAARRGRRAGLGGGCS